MGELVWCELRFSGGEVTTLNSEANIINWRKESILSEPKVEPKRFVSTGFLLVHSATN
jgi:hypothetical protein